MERYREKIRRIMICVNVIDGIYDSIAKKTGVKESILTLLYALDDGAAHSQKEICEEWFIPKTTLNTVIREFVEKGYVTLNAGWRGNGKEKQVCLTEAGRIFARDILNRVYDLEQRAMEKALPRLSDDFVGELGCFTACLKNEAERFGEGRNI